MKKLLLNLTGVLYRFFLKRIFFLRDPESVHDSVTNFGARLGRSRALAKAVGAVFEVRNSKLEQTLCRLRFANPIGLAAGFDYRAKTTEILGHMGFGFMTIGTLTSRPCAGNDPPRLGRLVKSQSLLVNKGFKNDGVGATLGRLRNAVFSLPVGVSIGETNEKFERTRSEKIADVVNGFLAAESSGIAHSYYELNISCPNLRGPPEWYHPESLKELLKNLSAIKISRPIFVKMPISLDENAFDLILDAVAECAMVDGVVVGNLQRDRAHHCIDQNEAAKFVRGNFSGVPCRDRSDLLIKRSRQRHGKRFVIIGCGGVFGAADAYRKIRLGASLVQLITGLVFRGPQLASQINCGLLKLIKRDGFERLEQAIGADAKK